MGKHRSLKHPFVSSNSQSTSHAYHRPMNMCPWFRSGSAPHSQPSPTFRVPMRRKMRKDYRGKGGVDCRVSIPWVAVNKFPKSGIKFLLRIGQRCVRTSASACPQVPRVWLLQKTKLGTPTVCIWEWVGVIVSDLTSVHLQNVEAWGHLFKPQGISAGFLQNDATSL